MSYSQFVNDLKELKIKKKGKKPKVNPSKFYPSQSELQAAELIGEELSDYAQKMAAAARTGKVKAVYDTPGAVPDSFRSKAAMIAADVNKFNVLAFANYSELVVGERFFVSSDKKNEILSNWTENFVNLCKSTNEEMRKKVAGVISDGVLSGRNLRETVLEVQHTCSDFTRSKAELIATTEVGKLNSAIARNQSESAGIEYYEWSAAMDGRTRESHAVMDGKICKWGDDEGFFEWEEQQDGKRKLVRRVRPGNAYKGAPGTDFRCRCVALPYVPEYEDDYDRENAPTLGVTQGLLADPKTMKRNASILSEGKEKKRKIRMLYRDSDKYTGKDKTAYILRRNADQMNYKADLMRYDVSNYQGKKLATLSYNYYSKPDGSTRINAYLKMLKSGDVVPNRGFDERAKAMADWIERNPMPESKVLYRSFPLEKDKIDGFIKNKRVTGIGGFQSSSASIEHSRGYLKENMSGVVLIISCKKGDKVAPPLRIKDGVLIGYPEEQEYNFLPNATFKIEDVEKDVNWKGDICYITCKAET